MDTNWPNKPGQAFSAKSIHISKLLFQRSDKSKDHCHGPQDYSTE
jgi:hypothetical protein